jgi:hypothetical protein
MPLEVRLVHSSLSQSVINFLVLEKVVGLDAVDAHVMLDAFFHMVLVFLLVVISLIDSHAGPGRHLQLSLLVFAGLAGSN